MITTWLRARRRAPRVAQLEVARREVKAPTPGIVVWSSREDAIRHAPPRLADHLRSMARKSERIVAALEGGQIDEVRDDMIRLHRHLVGLLREAEGRITR